jgi:hypothetical protein
VVTTAAVGCSQQAISTPVRSLEQSGRAAFVCLTPDADEPGAPLDACAVNAPTWGINHLYAMVTQTARGEVAIIDLTDGNVLDLDQGEPGYSFVPVGAQPVDIVATPGSSVAFVGSGEPNKYGIYVLPLKAVRQGAPRLTEFAACALPSAPGRMLVLTQPEADDGVQRSCDGAELASLEHPNGDLSLETTPRGARKLLVTLPDRGEVAILDAQELLDAAPGSFGACRIERLIKLKVELPAVLPQQRVPEGAFPPGQDEHGGACVQTAPPQAATESGFKAHPVHLSHDPQSGMVYIADDAAPVIHVLDVSDPCSPAERPPLLPMAVTDPWRAVFTREVAISPTTTAGKKFLYAIDHREGSMMVFDVSLGSSDRTPLLRPYPERNPFQARDRVAFNVPIKSVVFVLRDPTPLADPTTGAAAAGLVCDPDINSSALGAGYRTSADFATGAGPRYLRGIYAAAVLTNGEVVFIDVDDFDAPCRRPKQSGWCSNETSPNYEGANGELSCRVIEPHQPRNAAYLAVGDVPGGRMPGLQAYPSLTQGSTTLPFDNSQPRLLAPRMTEAPGVIPVVQVGGRAAERIESNPLTALHHMVWFDQREPRAHFDQEWTVVWEGQIPGFSGHVARLVPAPQSAPGTLEDGSGYFCDRGVHDFAAAVRYANSLGYNGTLNEPSSPAYAWAQVHVDVVQVTGGILAQEDSYWGSVAGTCSYQECVKSYGQADITPLSQSRDLAILEAYQDRVVVSDSLGMMKCCFPMLSSYTVRAQQQWLVSGSVSGFLHKVTTDPDTGRCVDSCDPSLRLRNGRALYWPTHFTDGDTDVESRIPAVDDPGVFRNPVLQFWIHPPIAIGAPEPSNPAAQRLPFSERDKYFAFTTAGGFFPLLVNLASSTTYVQPQSVTYLPQLGQLAVADGSVQGLMMVDLGALTLSKAYY